MRFWGHMLIFCDYVIPTNSPCMLLKPTLFTSSCFTRQYLSNCTHVNRFSIQFSLLRSAIIGSKHQIPEPSQCPGLPVAGVRPSLQAMYQPRQQPHFSTQSLCQLVRSNPPTVSTRHQSHETQPGHPDPPTHSHSLILPRGRQTPKTSPMANDSDLRHSAH